MFFKKTMICAILLFNCCLFISQAQTTSLLVKDKTGKITSFELNNVRRLTFRGQTLNVKELDTNESSFELTDLQVLNFGTISGILSIEKDQYNKINVFPNPVLEQLNCELITDNTENLSLQIISIDGRVMIQKNYLTSSGLNRITIPVSLLQTGIYIIRIQNSDIIRTIKFIKK